jgi:hypothetical protein
VSRRDTMSPSSSADLSPHSVVFAVPILGPWFCPSHQHPSHRQPCQNLHEQKRWLPSQLSLRQAPLRTPPALPRLLNVSKSPPPRHLLLLRHLSKHCTISWARSLPLRSPISSLVRSCSPRSAPPSARGPCSTSTGSGLSLAAWLSFMLADRRG